jgi:uncharacterized protein YdhG (YjbR/CyaY superfamily)
MEEIRRAIKAVVTEDDATETIAYKMPAFRSPDGRFLVSYDAFKNHYSLFPASDAVVSELGDRLTPYLAGKGTIRFPAIRPIPADLITEIARIRLVEHTADRG